MKFGVACKSGKWLQNPQRKTPQIIENKMLALQREPAVLRVLQQPARAGKVGGGSAHSGLPARWLPPPPPPSPLTTDWLLGLPERAVWQAALAGNQGWGVGQPGSLSQSEAGGVGGTTLCSQTGYQAPCSACKISRQLPKIQQVPSFK